MKALIGKIVLALLIFVGGASVGMAARHKLDASLYHGKSKQDAAHALLEAARVQAEDGSWERIAVGRLYYLSGAKKQGAAIFDDVLAKKHKSSDEYRIARVYREAGDWDKAKPMFDKFLADNPKDEKGYAEVGAYYLMNGDRATAEKLFDRSFEIADEFWATLAAAGAYLNVVPEE